MEKWRTLTVLLSIAFTKFQFCAPHPELTAPLHSDVLLPTNFTLKDSKNGLKQVSITWKHNGVELAQYKDGKMKSTGKADLLETELQKGSASLLVRDVAIGDEGDYEFEVHDATNTSKGSLWLQVTAVPKVFVTSPLVLMGQTNSLECHAEGFYPRNISIEWFKDLEPLTVQEPLHWHITPDGTLVAMSRYNYTPSSDDIGGDLSCQVKHVSLDGGQVKIPFQICSPTLRVSTRTLLRDEKVNVTCTLDGCLFSHVTVSWKKNKNVLRKEECDRVKECASEMPLRLTTAEEEKEEFSCEAEIEGHDGPLTKNVMFTIQDEAKTLDAAPWILTGVFSLVMLYLLFQAIYRTFKVYDNWRFAMSDIEVPSIVHAGQRVTLKCCFTGNDCKIKKVTWRIKRKGKVWQEITGEKRYCLQNCESIKNDQNEGGSSLLEQTAVLLTDQMFSSVTFVPEMEDEEVTVQCKVIIMSANSGRIRTRQKKRKVRVNEGSNSLTWQADEL
ncbi:butyrophilin subfamily 1 member A1-like [Polypterus senegalus]|uniref:butyrophilin subfamily 1 member A1-like n=1 Tax=Polypterus senegalus TaxID=55291 RepID=UPI001963F369|nr:butyrophilin subfamily 1 member A1-like [Polypterus senegalus]XP_039621053.1 butyrophilin subfamily 1 member A1-like [Polypterus senegalus]